MKLLKKVLLFFSLFLIYKLTCVSTVLAAFHYKDDDNIKSVVQNDDIEDSFLLNPKVRKNFDRLLNRDGEHFYTDRYNVTNETVTRTKREEDPQFYGHPKTREERWHANFNLNKTSLQLDQANSLVTLLVKVMDKYLNACTPIILYDHFVENSEGVILQKFFQVEFDNISMIFLK